MVNNTKPYSSKYIISDVALSLIQCMDLVNAHLMHWCTSYLDDMDHNITGV